MKYRRFISNLSDLFLRVGESVKKGELEQQIICYLSVKDKVRVEDLRKALGASKSIYRTLSKLKDAGIIEIEKVRHKERYVRLVKKPIAAKASRIFKTITVLPNAREPERFLECLEKQALIAWWSFIRAIIAERVTTPEFVLITEDIRSRKLPKRTINTINLGDLFELSPRQIKDLISFMLIFQRNVLMMLDRKSAEKAFRVAKERLRKLSKELEKLGV